jgi:acetylornithine deacetylase/succinyl-diaminopimelate desuccinylase-like protein
VIRPFTTAKISLRLPPPVDPDAAADGLRTTLLADPPPGARISLDLLSVGAGFDAPEADSWLATAADDASRRYFGAGAMNIGQGGTNPFLALMRAEFPLAQFLATGVLGPGSNAHAPDEMLDLPTVEKLTACLAHVLSGVPR